MQAADRLYGITMQERGVSTRVSVRFEDVTDDGHINLPRRTELRLAPVILKGGDVITVLQMGIASKTAPGSPGARCGQLFSPSRLF